MGRTKSIGIAGRFGARYGSSLRKKWREIMERRYNVYQCPYCSNNVVMERLAFGIWQCPKCKTVWAGAAYTPWSLKS
ncbi:MAG: 50S ribosomal protein L37ae [Ignisphaera sp.]|uniref:Large ribosomal subunit protein eL43 n=1 Tax=Ignisphaera aggregans TaxID=334771 RepID=A0A7J3MZG1_9CREN